MLPLPPLSEIFSAFSPATFGANFFDVILVSVIIFYVFEGISVGFIASLLDFVSFVCSFVLALAYYNLAGDLLIVMFAMPAGFANAFGFFIIALISEIIFSLLFRTLLRFLPARPSSQFSFVLNQLNHILGFIPGLLSSLILLSFLLNVLISLPASPSLKHLATSSAVGSFLIANTAEFETRLNYIFGGAINETLTFLTIEPQSTETVDLHFRIKTGKIDAVSEDRMFVLVNKEREQAGLSPLVSDEKLRDLARSYAGDMLSRGYFSHYNPEGLSPFHRMLAANIPFLYAGENLALAPTVDLAMHGLINSEGHRENILSDKFGKVGIGVVDGGIYGKMFVQEFTD